MEEFAMREKLQRFMYGRYGVDDLNQFLMYATLVLLLIGILVRSSVYNFLVLLLIIFYYYRMMSKNHSKRYEENQRFIKLRDRVTRPFRIRKMNKGYHIYTCPSCKQKIRIPKGKGKISITCPKCRTEFTKRS